MLVLQDIMKALKVSENVAIKIRDIMQCEGFDFSECTNREFNRAAKDAYATLAEERTTC